MSVLPRDLVDAVRARSTVQTLAEENVNLRFALQRLADAVHSEDPDALRLAEIQARATLKQSEHNAGMRR